VLYSISTRRAIHSGAFEVRALEPSGFRLIESTVNPYVVNVAADPILHTFYYESLATQVQIRAIDVATGELIPNFTPFYVPAILEQPFIDINSFLFLYFVVW
jgi:hypothetical protein